MQGLTKGKTVNDQSNRRGRGKKKKEGRTVNDQPNRRAEDGDNNLVANSHEHRLVVWWLLLLLVSLKEKREEKRRHFFERETRDLKASKVGSLLFAPSKAAATGLRCGARSSRSICYLYLFLNFICAISLLLTFASAACLSM